MYTVDQNGVIKRIADGFIVPKDVGDLAYQAYLYWVQTGSLWNMPASASPAAIQAAIITNDSEF